MTFKTPSGTPALLASWNQFETRRLLLDWTYLHDGEVGVWGLGWDLDYCCTSGRDDWGDLSSNHSRGKVPSVRQLVLPTASDGYSRNKQGANTDRLLDNNIPSSINRTRNNLSITPNSLPSEPVDITSSISSFSNSIIPRFPILPNDQSCDILQVLLEEIMHLSQVALSLGWSCVSESLEGFVGYFDCLSGIFKGHFRACSDDFSCCWVCRSAMSPLERVDD
jgi:hypothetical protein